MKTQLDLLLLRSSSVLVSISCLAVSVHAGGNVSVHVDGGGNLIVEGDGADNEILIMPFEVGEGFVVGLGTTLVNGDLQAFFSGADDDFKIVMRGGNDTIQIDDGDGNEAPDDLEIDAGQGNDVVLVRHFLVHDDLKIRLGSGDDVLTLSQTAGNASFVLDKTDIDLGAGNDQVLFEIGPLPDTHLTFGDDFVLRGGAGRDFVSILGALFEDDVDVNLGTGDDLGELGGVKGGLCVCGSIFLDPDVLDDVRFSGGDGQDGAVLESVCGIAPPGLVQDFLRRFEVNPDDCSFLGGEACKTPCQ